jgi:hypothetical protein
MRPSHAIAIGLVLLCAATAQAALTHRYSFNDGTANDSVGAANGVLVNGASVSNGQLVFSPNVNTGFNSNPATGQYVDLPNNIAATRALTLEAWTTYRGGSNWQRIADFGNNSSGKEILPSDKTTLGYYGVGFIMLTPSNTFFDPIAQISVNSSGGPDTDFVGAVDTPLTQNVQHHVVFTHDPDAGLNALWVDGKRLGQSVAQYDSSGMDYKNYWIGRSNFQQDAFYNGTINEFRIYNHGLTAAEVAANYARGADAVPEPAVAAVLALAAGAMILRRPRMGRGPFTNRRRG